MKPAKLAAAVLLAAAVAWAQQNGPLQNGPMQAPSNPPVIKRIPLYPEVPPPPMSPGQIVQHFLANEAQYKAAYETYGFLQTIRVEELGANGDPTGSFQVQTQVFPRPGGKQYERVVNQGKSSLQVLSLEAPDLEAIAAIPAFPLAGASASDYSFTYRGTEKQGELMTYAFQVEPKSVQPGHTYFSGVVWVDNIDLAIVETYGHFVGSGPESSNALPFAYSFFETYRENVAGKYWFPSYIRSTDSYGHGDNQLPIRLIVMSSNFHPGQPQFPAPKAQ